MQVGNLRRRAKDLLIRARDILTTILGFGIFKHLWQYELH